MNAERHTTHQTSSFLVRCWAEPREQESREPVVRVYVRNLKTGKEQYLSSPIEVAELLLRDVEERRQREVAGDDDLGESESAEIG